jgi:colanic acid/amylovoran biosynthesis glycosyltransferase
MPSKPVLLSYCATFLKPEMLHVYRQVKGIQQFDNWVVTRRRSNVELFPYSQTLTLKKSPWRGIRRAYYRLLKQPVPLGSGEVRQMLSIAAEKDAALIHVYFGTEAARALPYLQREQRPKVVSFHGADVSTSLSAAHLELLIACTDLFLARSQTLSDELLARGCPAEKIRLTRTSVPLPEWAGPLQLVAGQPVRLLQACRFIEKKGLDVAVAAVGQLVAAGHDVTLDLAGDGPEREALQAQAKQLGIADRVRFLGFLPNQELLDRLSSYTLFLHPSRDTASGDREGIPNSMLEAMAYGLPVVATSHSGIPEAVKHGIEGLLIEQNNVDALVRAVSTAVANAESYRVMSAASRARIESEFSAQRAIEELERAYADAIAQGKVRAGSVKSE